MAWSKLSIIRKMYVGTLSSSNNFTINLDTVGMGTWNHSKVKTFVMLKSISMFPQDKGYNITVSRVGSTSSYSCSMSTTSLNFDSYRQVQTTGNSATLVEDSDSGYTYGFINTFGGNGNEYIRLYIDNVLHTQKTSGKEYYYYQYLWLGFGNRRTTTNARTFRTELYSSAYTQYKKHLLRNCKYVARQNTDFSILCLFVEGE